MSETLDFYEQNAQSFIDGTVNVDMSAFYSRFLEHLPSGAAILDLGCGSGRDSRFFSGMGYRVAAIDGSPELCRRAEELTGLPIRCLLFENLDYDREFDGVWASAALLHVEKEKMGAVLDRVAAALKPGGILYASYKYGSAQRKDDNGRFFSDYTEADLPVLFPEGGQLSSIGWWITQDERPERRHEWWLNLLCKKE